MLSTSDPKTSDITVIIKTATVMYPKISKPS